jgi:hypothetical protein
LLARRDRSRAGAGSSFAPFRWHSQPPRRSLRLAAGLLRAGLAGHPRTGSDLRPKPFPEDAALNSPAWLSQCPSPAAQAGAVGDARLARDVALVLLAARGGAEGDEARRGAELSDVQNWGEVPPLPPVQSGHVSSITPY